MWAGSVFVFVILVLWGSRSLGFTGTELSVQRLSVQGLQFTGVGSRSLVFFVLVSI